MKKLMRILILSMLSVFLVAGSAMAFPFIEVEGNVNPYAATITDIGGGQSNVTGLEYAFTVTDDGFTGAEMNWLSLEFENDVFTSVSSLTFVNPTDWMPLLDLSISGSVYKISSAGTTIWSG